ncbi:MAG: hypothetical protein EKK37_08680 [Sphingobacteriales bacterium]|nr:MAG: hypothetical protein EKK37_08680 [Sphingobacteriales bacterium]
MKYILILLMGAASFTSCKKQNDYILPNGIYKGIFYRTAPWSDTAQVTLTINGNHYSGESNKSRYPAICNGTFSINNGIAKFENSCPWTADFDWTLILNGEYNYKNNNGKIEFSREYGDFAYYKDVYQLTKQ